MPKFSLAWLLRAIWFEYVRYVERNNLMKTPETFERFLLHLLLSEYRLDTDVENVQTGGLGDNFIDGIIITVNGKTIDIPADFYALHGRYLKDFQIEFIQVTSTKDFSNEKLEALANGSCFFVDGSGTMPRNALIENKRNIKDFLVSQFHSNDLEATPNIVLTYIWPGKISGENLAHAKGLEDTINRKYPAQKAAVKLFDTDDILGWTSHESLANEGCLSRHTLVACPTVLGADATFVGYASARDVLELVCYPNSKGRINYDVFYDNVRAFLGWTEINKSIASTLQDPLRSSEFLLRNNGITITARSFEFSGDSLRLRNFQIVNGCQTCSVLAKNSNHISNDCFLPVKIICSDSDDVIDKAIEGANRQNQVGEFATWSRCPFAKRLAIHCKATQNPATRIYLARQENQWGGAVALGKIDRERVVELASLTRFVSVLNREPHQVQGADKGDLSQWFSNKEVLAAEHSADAYHLVGLALCICRSQHGFNEWDRDYGAKYHLVDALLRILAN